MLEIYVDGACSGNGNKDAKGGCSFVVVENNKLVKYYAKMSDGTTNNREELKAILLALTYSDGKEVTIYSDSAYSINTLTNWAYTWEKKGWIKSDKKTPENLDIIKPAFNYIKKHNNVKFVKVKGHSGVIFNELADSLAADNNNKTKMLLEKLTE